MISSKNKVVLALLLVVFACLWRVLQVYNFSPIAATTLFAGAVFGRKAWAFALPLIVAFVSDILVNMVVYHMANPFEYFISWGTASIYLTYILIAFMGNWVGLKGKYARVPLGAISASLLFFIITNTAVWLTTTMYPKTVIGLQACYIAALPFMQNTFLGDLVFSLFFFGSFYLAQSLATVKQKI